MLPDLPCPALAGQSLLIRTRRSLISAGTERMIVEFGKASLLQKARSQPDKVRQVLDRIRTDGLLPTLDAVFRKLDEPIPLGYCNVGVVEEVARGVRGFEPGDRVASNGPHAEWACVPANLCAKVPDEVSDDQAAFTVLGSIALQGLRLAGPTLGERFVVYGLGLIGLLCVQLLRASGCEVLGVDLNPTRLSLAESMGAETVNASSADALSAANAWTAGRGVDGVLIAAAADTDEIVRASARMCRKRGRIVLVGVVGLNLRRSDFYEKELSFQVSCSYGPGRYDEAYEQGGQDYPYGLVRWTAQRNFEAVLGALRRGEATVDPLISHRFAIDEAPKAYRAISEDRSVLGVLLDYPRQAPGMSSVEISPRKAAAGEAGRVGVIGAGAFAKSILLPALARTDARITHVADLSPRSAQHAARTADAGTATSDHRVVLDDPEVDAVCIAVGHHLHARFVREALEAGKHVFVEKPLAMNVEEVGEVLRTAEAHPDRMVMVGFNRRFSPHVVRMRELLAGRSEPLCMTMTVNAGIMPADHWVQDPMRGGGRIVGEACHFLDLLAHLAGGRIIQASASMMGGGAAVREDKMSISISLADGSVANVNYFANGSRGYPKETLTVFSEGRTLHLDNFRRLTGYGFPGFRSMKGRQDKGHRAEAAAFVEALRRGGECPVPFSESVNATLASFAAVSAAAESRTVVLDAEYADLSPCDSS